MGQETSGKSLLVVDDEEGFGTFVAEVANDLGYDTRVTTNGREFTKSFTAEKPAVVVMDVVMPGMDGVELAGWLAEQEFDGHVVVVTGYAPPWDSWADMSQLLAVESGDASSLHYLVSTLPDDGRAELDEWLDWHGHFLFARDGARWDPRDEVMRYVRENKEGSARYVQSPPGSIGLRLRPGGSGVPNLWLAGDWTRTTLSAGSAEAAVQSGMLAARALGGHPVDIAM